MTSLLEGFGAYEGVRLAQIVVTVVALTAVLRHGIRCLARMYEVVFIMLLVLLVLSFYDLFHSLTTPHTVVGSWGWVVFDASISLAVLRFIREQKKLLRRPRLGGRVGSPT